jgi:hypothetical protein
VYGSTKREAETACSGTLFVVDPCDENGESEERKTSVFEAGSDDARSSIQSQVEDA